ncbi:L-threonylcarbamoyladenylate synthase [Streptosporangium saharense]|uniref:L-threonylcarbamoyladenylate synthase n=1 Tax=Streptosporangium saharense TaxID=1706840 RepID=UPI0036C8C7DF
MSRRYDCSDPDQRAMGLADVVIAIPKYELVVFPTDTVYGVGVDAFIPPAVTKLLEAKGRGRDMPPPVLVGTVRAATALVDTLGPYGQDLIDAFWPGPLTLICRANRSLSWDLGDTKGTVAIRMPQHPLALELLKQTGPLAVSSANRSGAPAATTAAEAEEQLGDSVGVYLDGGPTEGNIPSTILDLTTAVPRLLRRGAIPVGRLRGVVGYVATDGEPEPDAGAAEAEQKAETKPEPGTATGTASGAASGTEVKPEAGAKPESRD